MNWQDYIHIDPEVCHGRVCIQGTRVMVSVIQDNIAAVQSIEAILQSYPSLSYESIQAVVDSR